MSTLATNAITDASGGNTATINSYTPTESNMAGRNRIINGDMRIDQRNAGAAVTATSSYPVDRFQMSNTSDGAFSAQQDSSAPSGFVNSVKVTTTTADATLATTQRLTIRHILEGTNISDLAWGTASAKTVTMSFWVRSSLTGTFGGALQNGAGDRAYPFTYSISVADTWEQKSVTIAGDTSGTWLTTTGRGILIFFGLGAGPDTSGTAGAWAGVGYTSATGAVSVIGTLSATWQITGVQLEAGSVATPFERRQYGQELALCHRYCYVGNSDDILSAIAGSTTGIYTASKFPTTMRANPSASVSGTIRISDNYASDYTANATVSGNSLGVNGGRMFLTGFSGITVSRFYAGYDFGTGGKFIFSAEL